MSSDEKSKYVPDIGDEYNDHFPTTMAFVAAAQELHQKDVVRQKEAARKALRADLDSYVKAAKKVVLSPR